MLLAVGLGSTSTGKASLGSDIVEKMSRKVRTGQPRQPRQPGPTSTTCLLIGPLGFEPRLTDPKSAVLPLDEGPVRLGWWKLMSGANLSPCANACFQHSSLSCVPARPPPPPLNRSSSSAGSSCATRRPATGPD